MAHSKPKCNRKEVRGMTSIGMTSFRPSNDEAPVHFHVFSLISMSAQRSDDFDVMGFILRYKITFTCHGHCSELVCPLNNEGT